MELNEVINKLNELKGVGLSTPYTLQQKDEIEYLYNLVLLKKFQKTGCGQCYHDAVIEMLCYIRKYGKMKEPTNYRLRAGIIINNADFHNGEVITNENMTDAVAEEFLEKYPMCANWFSKMPEKPAKVEESVIVAPSTRKSRKKAKNA